jgi:hypothetical protein
VNSPRVSKPNENKPEVTVDAAKRSVLPYMESVTMNIEQKKEKKEQRVPGSLATTRRHPAACFTR